ncbi:MAG: hypothetical protein JEZ07_12770 [Phycisphaerae bacterium]|nr:hypothetical protein [Phycisphaerae bacterium]
MSARGKFLGLLVAYFGGAISMLFFLTPGDMKLSEKFKAITDPDKKSDIVSFEAGRDRVTDATDELVNLIRKSREDDS